MKYLKFKKNTLKEKFLPAKFIPDTKTIIYDGENVQLLLFGKTMISHVPMPGSNVWTERSSTFAMLFAKKINKGVFTYIGYYPEKRDQISIHPFKKFGALYVSDYEELAEKVSKKHKNYTRYDAIDVFKEYDEWLGANK